MKIAIVAVALQHPSGLIFTVPRAKRHHHIINNTALSVGTVNVCRQGFLTSDGVFVDREAAMLIAIDADQVIKRPDGTLNTSAELFSEDVW